MSLVFTNHRKQRKTVYHLYFVSLVKSYKQIEIPEKNKKRKDKKNQRWLVSVTKQMMFLLLYLFAPLPLSGLHSVINKGTF